MTGAVHPCRHRLHGLLTTTDDYCVTGRLLFPFRPAGAPRVCRRAQLVRRMHAKSLKLVSSGISGVSIYLCGFYGSNASSRAALLSRLYRDDFNINAG